MKKKVLIIFKYPHEWNEEVIKKLENNYKVEFLYINELKSKYFKGIIDEINVLIKSKDIEITVFDADYYKFINLFFIKEINSKKKILITQDDLELHELNAVTASSCDVILSACPLSVLKYKEKGYDSYYFPPENLKINENNYQKRDYDVIFFGHLTPDRKEILDYISNAGISVKILGNEIGGLRLPRDKFLETIKKAKIVLNLSKSRDAKSIRNYSSESIYRFFYQIKGRIWDAGLNGVLCVSEYSPGQELLFENNEIPTFYEKDECVKILKELLNNEELLSMYKNKFLSKVKILSEKFNNFDTIYQAIEKPAKKRFIINKVPYWYLRIVAKQILLRNLKLINLLKAVLQFKIIFKILKKSNFITKVLVIFESIINIIWYSIILTFKSK